MVKKDKNDNDLEIGDNVKIGDIEYEIAGFKLRSYGWVAFNLNGDAYECAVLIKIIEEPPTEEKSKCWFF